MKDSKRKIAFKVLVGYGILAVLSIVSGILIISEIKNYIEIQQQGISDRSNIIQTGGLIADIYENENLGRAAIQLNSYKKYNEYLVENEVLLKKIDSLNFIVEDTSKKNILDSVKLVLSKKQKNVASLRILNQRNVSDKSINEAINKLGSIDSLLGKETVKKLVDSSQEKKEKQEFNLDEYLRLLETENEIKNNSKNNPVSVAEQKKIDSLVSASKEILKKAQRETSVKRRILRIKERELIENDLTISRKLREVLSVLERDVISNANEAYKKNEETLNRSKNIILLATIVGFLIIILFSVIILNDFWRSQHYRQKLESANATTSSLLKSREQLISMVSHDLRTPLSTITGFSELLQKSVNTKEKNYANHIQNASMYMKQLVEDLLEFSKLENGNTPIEKVPFDIENTIDEVVSSTKSLVENKPITVDVKHDESITTLVVSDPFRIKQILYNLVTNACKFTHKGSIVIASELKGKFVRISVQDTGIGIGKDKQENVFKEFTQAHEKEEGQKGFGLGLTISRRLAELLGGSLTLQSKLGEGSTFTLEFSVTFSSEIVKKEKKQEAINFSNLKAIVVEDDVAMRIMLQNVFSSLEIKATVFDNALEALKNIDTTKFDFVLTDIQLPKMNGIHFMETLKQQPSYNGQPIIAMTGRTNLSEQDYIQNGFSQAMIKPFTVEKLTNVLQQLFNGVSIPKEEMPKDVFDVESRSFDLSSLKSFLNNNDELIHQTLEQFLNDTEQNVSLLNESVQKNDINTFQATSHKMLSMFKLINANSLVGFLEDFENSDTINKNNWQAFKVKMPEFLKEIRNYLS